MDAEQMKAEGAGNPPEICICNITNTVDGI